MRVVSLEVVVEMKKWVRVLKERMRHDQEQRDKPYEISMFQVLGEEKKTTTTTKNPKQNK